MHRAPGTGSTRGPSGVRGLVMSRLGRGVWWVLSHGEPCEELQDCLVSALASTGLGWALRG